MSEEKKNREDVPSSAGFESTNDKHFLKLPPNSGRESIRSLSSIKSWNSIITVDFFFKKRSVRQKGITEKQNSKTDSDNTEGSSMTQISSNISAHSGDNESYGAGRTEIDPDGAAATRNATVEHIPSALSLNLQPELRIPKKSLCKPGENDPSIWGLSHNSECDELFAADFENAVVRSTRVRECPSSLRHVYKTPPLMPLRVFMWSVCYLSESDTLLLCSFESYKNWLVELTRSKNGSEWRETQRVKLKGSGWITCALSDSRVLIGGNIKKKRVYMELFRVKSGERIASLQRITITEEYTWFSATCAADDTRVAMSYKADALQEVRVHRLLGDRLEELARIQMQHPNLLLWRAYDRLLATESQNEKNSVIEIQVNGTRLERHRKLITFDKEIKVWRWCAVDDGLAIFDSKSRDILHYKI